MRCFALLFLFLGSCRPQENACPKDANLICIDGLFPDQTEPIDCTIYFGCVDCQSTQYTCPGGLHFDDYYEECRDPYLAQCDPVNYPRNGSAFCVSSSGGRTVGPLNPFKYTETLVNYKSPYAADTGYWSAANSGTFFFHLAGGTYPNERFNLSYAGSAYQFTTVRNSSHHQYDLVSRDMMMSFNKYATMAITLEVDSSTFSNTRRQNMWAGFNLEEFMETTIAFYAISQEYHYAVYPGLTLVFEDALINIGNAYNPGTGVFTAPVSGLYFFFISSGMEAGFEHRSQFVSNRVPDPISELWRGLGVNTGIDTIGKSIIYQLDEGQTMQMLLVGGEASNNQTTLLSFGGFLYDPFPGTPVRAWLVQSATSHVGPEDPLNFELETLNVGGLFDPSTDSITIDTSGFYYMSFYIGINKVDTAHAELMHDPVGSSARLLIDVDRSTSYNDYEDTQGRGILVHLKAGDKVWIRVVTGNTVYSDSDKQTTFSGFLLHAIENP